MASTILLSDNGVSSGSAGLKETGGNDGVLILQTTTSGGTATNALTIDATQQVGIGTATPATTLDVNGNVRVKTGGYLQFGGTGNNIYGDNASNILVFATNGNTERMRIDSSGNLLVGTTSQPGLSWVASSRLVAVYDQADYAAHVRGTNASPYGLAISYSTTPNSTGSSAIDFRDSTAQRFAVRSNGGIANYSANNVNLSDERTKTDIVDAGGYLSKICAIPVRTFKYKDQTDDLLNLGVIAQEVEVIAPELVDASGFGETPEDGIPLKAIYQTDLQYALMKCIQEQQALITTLTERITALEAK